MTLTIRRILCPVDLSEASRRALDYAVTLARWYDARLTVLSIYPSAPMTDVVPLTDGQALALSALEWQRQLTALQAFVTGYDERVDIEPAAVRGDDIAAVVGEQAAATAADLVVIGTHGRTGWRRVILGSLAERILNMEGPPVLIVPPHADAHLAAPLFTRIVCAVDDSAVAPRLVETAIGLAEEADAALRVVQVVAPVERAVPGLSGHAAGVLRPTDRVARDWGERLASMIPPYANTCCTVATDIREGDPPQQILDAAAAHRADLIVLGARHKSFGERLLETSTTHAVLITAACPVLVVRVPITPVQEAGQDGPGAAALTR